MTTVRQSRIRLGKMLLSIAVLLLTLSLLAFPLQIDRAYAEEPSREETLVTNHSDEEDQESSLPSASNSSEEISGMNDEVTETYDFEGIVRGDRRRGGLWHRPLERHGGHEREHLIPTVQVRVGEGQLGGVGRHPGHGPLLERGVGARV